MDNFQRQIRDMVQRVQAINGQEPTTDQLFPDAFVAAHTQFASFQMLLEQSGFKVVTSEDFKRVIATEEWNRFIAEHSTFANWNAMYVAAGERWAAKQAGFR